MHWLFSGADFMPRASCGKWEPWVLAIYVIANLTITAAYVAIPAALWWVRRRGGTTLPDTGLLTFFVLFIFACGLGHTIEAVIVWHPWYRFATLWHMGTATVSLVTAVVLARKLPILLQLRSPIELEHANLKLNAANEDLEQFAYCASHDLQEPLRTVTSFGALLRDEKGSQLDEQARRWVERMMEASTKMSTMVDDLLAFSRAGHGSELAPVDLRVAFEDAARLLAPVVDQRGARIEVDPLFTVEGDRSLLVLAAKNLLSNAIKYSPETPRVRVFAEGRVVCVQDHGIGIGAEHREKIFEVFTRLHRANEYTGTGIGLALVRRIAEHHSATVSVRETEGGGSTFCLGFQES